jgi:hypothetical protein
MLISCVAAAALSMSCVEPEMSLDGILVGADADPAAMSSEGKITICHVPPGNPENAHTITISLSAYEKHVEKHGDDEAPETEGDCTETDPTCDAGTTLCDEACVDGEIANGVCDYDLLWCLTTTGRDDEANLEEMVDCMTPG